MSTLSRVNQAHKRREAFIEIHQKSSLLELKLLYEIYKNKDWNVLGFDNFKDYCEAPVNSGGLAISREWATQLVMVYQKFVIDLELDEKKLLDVSPRKLYKIKNIVTKENVDEMIEKIKTLSLEDLEFEIHNKDTMSCQHSGMFDENARFLYKCKDCKSWVKLNKNQIKDLFKS
jgi:hypothetical protein